MGHFTIGLFVGGIFGGLVGITTMCLMITAKEADKRMQPPK